MVAYAAFLLLVCCSCLQHTGALQIAYDTSEIEDGGQVPGELLGALADRQIGRQKRGGMISRLVPPPTIVCDLEWKGDKLPIILYEGNHTIVSPETIKGQKIIRIKPDAAVIISCPGTGGFSSPKQLRSHHTRSSSKLSGFSAFCNSADGKLYINHERKADEPLSKFIDPPQNKNYEKTVQNMNDILCNNQIEDTVIATTEQCGDVNKYKYNIVTFNQEFYIQIEVCFDRKQETTLWSKHNLLGVKSKIPRTGSWKEENGLFTSNMKNLYTAINNQALLKITKLLERKVAPDQKFIAKGHLSPNADFNTEVERKATFRYINAVPQFQADNNGNWAHIVEDSVRELAKSQTELTIITGGHDILHLKHKNKQDVPIYLNPPKGVPVPKFMWKVVTNKAKTEGVAFVTSNDPFIGQLDAKGQLVNLSPTAPNDLCTDVCDELGSWFNGNDRKVYSKGYTYCCRVDDLRKNGINTIPSEYANVKKLLGKKNAGKTK